MKRSTSCSPSGQDYAADPSNFSALAGDQFAGLRLWPTGVPALDDLALSPVFADIARELTGSTDVRFVRGGYQAKYTDAATYTQVLHYDYPNHSLVVPAPNDILGFFLYLSDVDTAHGATSTPTWIGPPRLRQTPHGRSAPASAVAPSTSGWMTHDKTQVADRSRPFHAYLL